MNKFAIKKYFSNSEDGNVAFHVGLDIDEAQRNRQKFCQKHKINGSKLIWMEQTHSCNIEIVTKNSQLPIKNCDAIITNEVDLPLLVMVADCIPILIYDANKNIIAAVHSGRNGTFLKILEKTLEKMRDVFGSDANDIHIEFGPNIGFCCYEVNEEMAKIVQESFGKQFEKNRKIDLIGINLKMAEEFGIKKENIKINDVCTYCGGKNYFSYRKDKKCGRFCGIICIQKVI